MIALSTAFKKALIGISIDEKEKTLELDANCKHSENLLFSLDKLLESMGKSIKDNDSFGVVIGPGSFTGVRIAISLVKGLLAGDSDKEIVILTSFELMAYTYINQQKPTENFVCAVDALSGLYFVCEFDKEGNKIGKEKMITQNEYDEITFKKVSLTEEKIQSDVKIELSAKDLLLLCKEKKTSGNLSKMENLLPLYLRKSQAEVSLEERLKKS